MDLNKYYFGIETMQYHYAEGWIRYLHRISMHFDEAYRKEFISYQYTSIRNPNFATTLHIHFKLIEWFEENIGVCNEDWEFNVLHKDQTIWLCFTTLKQAELFKLTWG